MNTRIDLISFLHRYWGYESFRPKQEDIIRSLLEGHDVAAVMPTGGGKSLCYQLPAVALGKTAIVVSPLIALMQDQLAQLTARGIPAAVWNSAVEHGQQGRVRRLAHEGAYRLLYLSPERLAREETFGWLRGVPLAYFAIDEAHCISDWGHEFRPEYRQLSRLRESFPDVPIAAFTASATQRVRHDILYQLRLHNPHKYILGFHRPNLRYLVKECGDASQRQLLLAALRAHAGKYVIVYVPTIARVASTVSLLSEAGIAAIPYHGQMDSAARKRHQDRWMSGETRVLVGTVAFGLGIDKPDVRAVIHLSLPKSLEQYYQEAGRAGRDGLPSDCALLWQRRDAGLLAHFIQQIKDEDESNRAWHRYRVLRRFAEGGVCRHRQVCQHFGQSTRWRQCGSCDICGPLPEWFVEPERQPTSPDIDESLFDHLTQWRRQTAKEQGVPAYVVLNNAGLRDLCVQRPQSRAELLRVNGIGPKRAERYGKELLVAIARHAS